jgi:hypothetical protein
MLPCVLLAMMQNKLINEKHTSTYVPAVRISIVHLFRRVIKCDSKIIVELFSIARLNATSFQEKKTTATEEAASLLIPINQKI